MVAVVVYWQEAENMEAVGLTEQDARNRGCEEDP